jgi:hypothetical protein
MTNRLKRIQRNYIKLRDAGFSAKEANDLKHQSAERIDRACELKIAMDAEIEKCRSEIMRKYNNE